MTQDEMRIWVKERLAAQGRGARRRLADFLGLTPNHITLMLNTEKNKAVRAIKADEWLKIEQFFDPERPLQEIKNSPPSDKARLITIYDSFPPDVQQALLSFAEVLSRRIKPNLARGVSRSSDRG